MNTSWECLTDRERSILASKLVPGVSRPTVEELKFAREVFEELINRPDLSEEAVAVSPGARQVSERIAAVKNFVDLVGGEHSAVWNHIDRIQGVSECGGLIEVTVNDRHAFIQALKCEGYAVNARWDIFGSHSNDTARQLTGTSWEPGLHFANDDSSRITTYWAHVDRRSAHFRRTTYASRVREMIDAGRDHRIPSIPSQIRRVLRINEIAPRDEPAW